MNKYIMVPGTTRPAQAHHMAEILFGNRKAKTPAEGFPSREVQGIIVWGIPRDPSRRFFLRVMCYCPVCKKPMPVGRLHQHSKIHQGE